MKKIVLLLTIAILLTGCTMQEHKKTVISFWTLQMGDFSTYINDIISEYEVQNPDIKIKWTDVPFSEGEKRTLAAVMTDNPPDLINLNPDFSAILAQKGTLWEIDEKFLEEFNNEIVNALKYNDKIYSIPWYATSAVTIYNKNLLHKSGISNVPKTYDELADISKIIKGKTGSYAYIPTITENDTMLKIMNKYGISDYNMLNSDKSIKLFDMFKELYIQNLIPAETITMTHREALEQYMSGKVVFYQGGSNFLNLIKENSPDIYSQTDVSEQLKGPAGQNDFSVMNFVIPQRAKNKEEALKFCLYLTNEKNQLILAKMTNVVSTNKNALKDKFYNDYSDLTAKSRTLSAKQINRVTPYLRQVRSQKEINMIINDSVQQILLNKNTTDIVLEDAVKKINSLMQK